MPAKLLVAAAAMLFTTSGFAASSTYDSNCKTNSVGGKMTITCESSSSYDSSGRPSSREDVIYRKAVAPEVPTPIKPVDNQCGPGFRMLSDYSCQLLAR